MKLLGAAYLIWLGLQSLLRARGPTRSGVAPAAARRDIATRVAARQGFLSNVLNPRTAAFYLALLPQFAVFPNSVLVDSLTLAGVHLVSRAMDFIAGASLLGFGLRLAVARR